MAHGLAVTNPDIEAQKESDRLPRHVTIEESHGVLAQQVVGAPYRRTTSRQTIEVEARIPTEFRTLSIHVDTKTNLDLPGNGDTSRGGNNVKGTSNP